jgi:hypothetical protein
MVHRVTRQRVSLGPLVSLVGEDDAGVEIEAPIRLAPGRTVDVVRPGDEPNGRLAVVWSWRLVSMGRDGPVYRGICRWL